MPGTTPARNIPASNLSRSRAPLCPFHDGAGTLDLLLAELDPADTRLFDAVLDLRTLWVSRSDPAACAGQLFRVRALLHGRHHLAFYRVRCWARRVLRVEVRLHRATGWVAHELPLGAGRLDEVFNTMLAGLAIEGVIPTTAHVRFAFA